MENDILTQEEMMRVIMPALKSNGQIFKKIKHVMAREAREGEVIHTITSEGHETSNTAKKGDYIVKNQTKAGEMYIVGGIKFHDRYDFVSKEQEGFSKYKPKGKVLAVEMNQSVLNQLGLGAVFYFIASWNEKMIVKENDFLVCQLDFSSIYRIARQEFFETYDLDSTSA